MGRKGIGEEAVWKLTFGIVAIIIGVVLIMASTGGLWTLAGEDIETTLDTSALRARQALELTSLTPEVASSIGFDITVDAVRIEEGELTLSKDGNSGSTEVLVRDFGTVEVLNTKEVCFKNDGELQMGDVCQIQGCTPGACLGDKTGGFYCAGGVWTQENFFTQFYRSGGDGCAGPQTGDFAAVNRFACPDGAEGRSSDLSESQEGMRFTCAVRVTYRCGDGVQGATVSLGSQTVDKSFLCTGDIESRTTYISAQMQDSPVPYSVSIDGSTRASGEVAPYDSTGFQTDLDDSLSTGG